MLFEVFIHSCHIIYIDNLNYFIHTRYTLGECWTIKLVDHIICNVHSVTSMEDSYYEITDYNVH